MTMAKDWNGSRLCAGLGTLLLLSAAPTSASSDPIADFYRGKTVTVLIGVGVGGEYDLHARMVARHLGKHIPGNPTIVPQNMTGAGGLLMANYLYEVAARDGTTIGMLGNNFPAQQAVGTRGIKFDTARFNWIGSISPTVETMATWKTTGVRTLDEATQKEVVAGATGRGAITYTFPVMLNELLGTRFKVVTGYQGGNAVNLAMERGEVGARNNTWSSWKVTKRAWLDNKDIHVLVQAGPKAPDLDAPTIEDVIRNDNDRKVAALIVSGTRLGRPLATPPGVPAERVKALRDAFMKVMQDPEFRKEADAAKVEIDPVPGEEMHRVVEQVLATPEAQKARAKQLIE
jgi:tripartite-type tricarboxylate transporter receptor subunit TctC